MEVIIQEIQSKSHMKTLDMCLAGQLSSAGFCVLSLHNLQGLDDLDDILFELQRQLPR